MPFGSIDMMEAPAEQGEGWGAPIPRKGKKRKRRERRAEERGVEYTPQGRGHSRSDVHTKNGIDQTLAAVERHAKRLARGKTGQLSGPAIERPTTTRQTKPTGRAARKRAQRELGGKKGGRR